MIGRFPVQKIAGATLVTHKTVRGEVALWSVTCDHFTALQLSALRKVLVPDECARADRFHFAADHAIYIAAHAMLRLMLSRYVAFSIRFQTNAWGKPELDLSTSDIRFNLTHTRGLAACAMTQIDAIGVDAEAQDRSIDVLSLAGSFFASSETDYLRTLPENRRLSAFLRFWTLKEAFIKAVGKGLSMQLDEFAFTLNPITFSCRPALRIASADWSFRSISFPSSHHLAVALHCPPDGKMTLNHRRFSPDELVHLCTGVCHPPP